MSGIVETLYEQNVRKRTTVKYILGLLIRWKLHFKYIYAVRIAKWGGQKLVLEFACL